MKAIQETYRHLIKGCLAVIFYISCGYVLATSDQTLTNKTILTLGSGLGDVAPAIAYNSNNNEYFVIYTDVDPNCPGNQELRGQIINAITGEKSGNELIITSSDQPCVTNIISNLEIVYNDQVDEYLIFYKSIGAIGNKSNLFYCSVNGSSHAITLLPTKLAGDAIADPYQDLVIGYDYQTNTYALGYHKINASSESSLTVDYLDAQSKSKKIYETIIDKTTFLDPNTGIFNAKIVSNGSNLVIIFELKFNDGSEIWGGIFNLANGEIINDYFQISPNGQSDKYFGNPAASYDETLDEIVIAYEQSYYSDPGEEYILSDAIRIQKINPYTGNLIGPTDVAISPLPGAGNTEDKKQPSIIISNLSNEFFIAYYGIRFAAGDDVYNVYLHRVDATNLTSISTSGILVDTNIGRQVLQNNLLKSLDLGFNSANNQFLLSWNTESANDVRTQVWRFDNNKPANLSISTTTRNEELPIGATFATLSATDPDPEDSSPIFSLASGNGSQDNSYFNFQGNELRINKRLSFEEAGTRNIRVKVTDNKGDFDEKEFSLTITDIDESPKNIILSGQLSVEENLPAGSFTSNISIEDDDLDDTHTLTLVAGDSSTHNTNFEIAAGTNVLTLNEPLNYEETSKQFVRIKAVDFSGLPYEKGFVINVIDINEKPEGLELTPNAIPENDAQSVAIVNVVDPDESPNYSFTMISGEGDDDNYRFNLSDNNKLSPINPLNFEEKSIYSVRLRAWDGLYDTTQAVEILVTDVNDPPEAVQLSENQIIADQPGGAFFAHIMTIDQDMNDTHSYEILEGSEYFFIKKTGDQYDLHILNSFIYDFSNPANNLYSVKIKSTDFEGISVEEMINVEVVLYKDEEKPKILQFEENPKFIDSTEDSLYLSILATDNEKLKSIALYLRQIRSVDNSFTYSDTIEINTSNEKLFLANIPLKTDNMDDMGIEYYFKVTDVAGNVDSTNIGHTYWSYSPQEFSATNSKHFNGSETSYRIISNPYDLESKKVSKIFAEYGSSNANSWRLFDYKDKIYHELGILSGSTIEQGIGYWFNKMDNLNQTIVFDKAFTPENHRDGLYSLPLKSGWNLIGNPYPFDLDWNHVLAENNRSELDYKLYTFDGNYKVATALNKFEGAFVYAVNDTVLKIPISDPSLSNNRIAQTNQFENGWLVNFTLDNGQIKNNLCGIGMHEYARQGFDKYDNPLLPRFIHYLDMSFSHPKDIAGAFSQDIVGLSDNHIWEFVVSTNHSNKHVVLSWNTDQFKNSENQLLLYDVVHDKTIDIRNNSQYELILENPLTFKAIYGDDAFIEETLNNIRIEALQPYPNPFTNVIRWPIILPYSQEPYIIDCSIYNLMGEKVFQEKHEANAWGNFEVKWTEDQMKNLKHGIYIYSIQVRNGFLTNNFHGRIVKN